MIGADWVAEVYAAKQLTEVADDLDGAVYQTVSPVPAVALPAIPGGPGYTGLGDLVQAVGKAVGCQSQNPNEYTNSVSCDSTAHSSCLLMRLYDSSAERDDAIKHAVTGSVDTVVAAADWTIQVCNTADAQPLAQSLHGVVIPNRSS